MKRNMNPLLTALILTALTSSAARAGDGLDWVTVGDPGNPAWEDVPTAFYYGRGSVDHEYRMMRTELSVTQWFEFVSAYAPFAAPENRGTRLTGPNIGFIGDPDKEVPDYFIHEGAEQYPSRISWRMAARYANWLHNDKALTAEAFQSGAYDTSTFTTNDDGTFNDQLTRSPGAQYWIPSMDEWMKAVYYDPALNGGAGGWWEQPNGSNTPLTVGLPDVGGETNAALVDYEALFGGMLPRAVGSYPLVQTPWGLLDASGGMAELTEEPSPSMISRRARGSTWFSMFEFGYEFEDRIADHGLPASPVVPMEGSLRLAAAIPSPPVAFGFVTLLLFNWRKRRYDTQCYLS